jgi:hypothetical protein
MNNQFLYSKHSNSIFDSKMLIGLSLEQKHLSKLFLLMVLVLFSNIAFGNTFFEDKFKTFKKQLIENYALDKHREEFYPHQKTDFQQFRKAISGHQLTSTKTLTMPISDCPDVEFIDLRNVSGYPQIDNVTACGAADTLSMIIFTGDLGEISGFEFEIDLPEGMEYGGFEYTQLGNTSIGISDPNPERPVFFVDGITGDSLVIVNIGIRANCNVDKTEMLFFDYNYEYIYKDTSNIVQRCKGSYRPESEFNSSVKMPVLNMLTPLSPPETTLNSLGDPYCQTIQISQDGLSTYVDSFTFEILNLETFGGDLILESININNTAYPSGNIMYDSGSMITSLLIDGSYFPNNTNNSPADNQFNTDELVVIEVCYQLDICPNFADLPFRYNVKFGCDDEICDDSGQNSFMNIKPTGALLPNVTAMFNAAGIEICGEPGEVSITLNNPNSDTDQNVYTDIQIGFQTCDKPNLEVVSVTVGGIAIPNTFYSWVGDDINIDLTTNTDATLGLVDYDDDGFFDDLPGGGSITAEVLIEISCGLNPDDCAVINCQDVQFYVDAKYNCGNSFKDFPVPDAFNLLYGPTAVSNPTEAEFGITGVFGYDLGTYSNNGAPLSTGESSVAVEFCYTFETLNIQDCPSGSTNFFKVDFVGAPRFMEDLEYTPNSASWSTDGGANYTPIADSDVNLTKADNESATLILNAGSDDMNVCYRYSITMDTCLCAPVGYFSGNQQVVSSCSDCSGGCEILKACRTTTFQANPNCDGCDCVVEQGTHISERVNFGYTDKTSTTKHTRESLVNAGGSIDLTRFLPGDTITHYDFFVIKDEAALENIGRWSFSWFLVDDTEGGQTSENLDLSLDPHNARLDKFQVSKVGVTTRSDIDFSILSNCLNPLDGVHDTYGSIWNWFNTTPWDESIGHRKSQNSSNDRFDNANLRIYIWNYENIIDCGGTNAHLGSGNCFDEMKDTYNFEVGDTIHIQWTAPFIVNPYRAAKKILGTEGALAQTAKVRTDLSIYQHDPIGGSSTYCETFLSTACREFNPIYFDVAGEINASTEMILDNCGGNVVHTFTVNDLPGPVGDPWFKHEYRPFMDITKVNGLIRAPLAYCANAQVDKLGVTYDVSVDSSQNLFCVPVSGYDEDICGIDTDQTTGNIFFKLTDQGVPALGIGFDNCDTLRLSYDLCMVCPQDITGISEYDLFYDWSYVNTPRARGTNTGFNQYLCTITTEVNEANSVCDEFGFGQSSDWYDQLGLDSLSNKTDRLSEVFLLNDNRNPQAPVTITNNGANLLAASSPGVSVEIQEVVIHNTDATMGATGVGASVTIPSAVRLEDVYTDAAGTMPLTKTLVSDDGEYKIYNISLPSDAYAANEMNSIFIGTTLLFCPDPNAPLPKVCVASFSGCAPEAIKAALGNAGGCSSSEICYAYISGEVGLQSEWFSLPDSSALCEEIIFNVRIKNVKELVLLDLIPNFDLPPGIQPISGSWEISYPGGEVAPLNWQPIGSDPDIVIGNTYSYSDDAIWSSKINADGLQGVSVANTTLDSNKVAFRFRATTNCDEFLSGSKLLVETTATDPCGASMITSGNTESPSVIIDNANPENFAQMLLVVNPKDVNCMGNDNTFGVTAINIGNNSTSDSVLICLTLPEELDFTSGSVVYTSPAGFMPNSVTETTIGTANEICFNAPAIGAYGTFNFEFSAAMNNNAECGKIRVGTDIKSFVDMITCTPGPPSECGVFVQNSIASSVSVDLNPPFAAEDLVVYTDCATDPNNVALYYEYTINHDGPDAVDQSYTVNFYEDIDGDQTVNSNIDVLLGTENGTFSVPNGETIQVSGSINVPAGQSCPILFEVVYSSTSCTCDREEQYFDNIKNRALVDYQEPIIMCPNSCIEIDVCDFVSVSADSIPSATGLDYELTIEWAGLTTYTLPSPGGPDENVTHEALTNNDIEPALGNPLIAEANTGNGYLVAEFPYVVNVDEVFLGGGNVAGWGNVIHVYGGAELLFEYSLDGLNWTPAGNGPIIPNTAIIQGTVIDPPVAGKFFRISSNGQNSNWATSEFRLEGTSIPFESASPVTQSGNTVSICIPEGVGLDTPWTVDFVTGTGDCEVTETIEIYQLQNVGITITGDTVACGSECLDLELIIPNDADGDMTVSWSPANLIDNPTAFRVEACNLSSTTTFEATVTYADGNCVDVIPWTVTYLTPQEISIPDYGYNCFYYVDPPILMADMGFDLYNWYEISTGFEILENSSSSNNFAPTEGGTYIVKATSENDNCPAISMPVVIPTDECRDYGDLPDSDNETGTSNYQTDAANGGPSHVIIPGLYLGNIVELENDGVQSIDAMGDGAEEDGVAITPNLNLAPSNVIRLPLGAVNTTGETAYIEAWIDWNGDGDFDDPGEMVANFNDASGSFPAEMIIPIPVGAQQDQNLGFRIRISNMSNITPVGPADSGEVEDYLLRISCPIGQCLTPTIEINRE